jgi:hypothetical protein
LNATRGVGVANASTLGVTGGGPARIFLNDGGTANGAGSGAVAQISGLVNPGGLPANIQIFYGGAGTLDLRGSRCNRCRINFEWSRRQRKFASSEKCLNYIRRFAF